MWARRQKTCSRGDPFVHEEYFIYRGGEWIDSLGAREIVEVQVCDVEELLQPADGVELVLQSGTVELDRELIDTFKQSRRCVPQRVPLGAFDVHLYHHVVRCIAVIRELILQ